jgi:hypothetical protein
MRTLTAIALALILAPTAAAAKPPLPIKDGGIWIIRLAQPPAAKHLASCSVHSRANTKLGRASRKILPVACEQPPKPNLTGISGSIQALLSP